MKGPKGEEYTLVILKVDERDSRGRPSKVTVGYDDTTFKVEEGMAFVTALIPVVVAKGKGIQ